jgi:hypothetical protein
MEGEKPELAKARPQEPVQRRRRGGDPLQEGLQLPIAQRTDSNGTQASGACGEQEPVPVFQRRQGEGRLQAAGGLQQHIQQLPFIISRAQALAGNVLLDTKIQAVNNIF